MKLTIDRDALFAALSLAAEVVPARTTRPALQSFLLKAGEVSGDVTVTATDLDVAVRVNLAARDVEPGAVLVPALAAQKVVRELPRGESLIVADDESSASITCASGRFHLPVGDVAHFPETRDHSHRPLATLQHSSLASLARRVLYAANQKAIGSAVGGVCLWLNPQSVRLVALDGRRMAVADFRTEASDNPLDVSAWDRPPVIPLAAAKLLSRLADAAEEGAACSIRVWPDGASFSTPRATLTTRLLEGTFPIKAVRAALGERHSASLKLPADEFLATVKRASAVLDKEEPAIKVSADASGLTVESADGGSARSEALAAGELTGDTFGFLVQSHFLSEPLRTLGEQEVELCWCGPKKNVILAAPDFHYQVATLSKR